MSDTDEDQGLLHRLFHKKESDTSADTPGADEFIETHETNVPWDQDRPIVREDEHYEELQQDPGFPSQQTINPLNQRPKL